MTTATLTARGLAKRFGDVLAVRSVDLELTGGRNHVLLGPNGAGKSTTIAMLAGQIRPDAGTIERGGANGAAPPIGLVPQQLAFHPDLTGRENLQLFGRLHGLSGHALQTAVAAALDTVALEDRASELAHTYSGGMQRRLNLAVALVSGATTMLLDEPTEGVDQQSKSLIFERLLELRDTGRALLITTHDMEDAEVLADEITVMDEGRVVAAGTLDELRASSGVRDRVIVQVGGPVGAVADSLRDLPEVQVAVAGDRIELQTGDGARSLPRILERVQSAGGDVLDVEVRRSGLGDLFLELTGRAMRDG